MVNNREKNISHYLKLNLKKTVSGDSQSTEFPAVHQNKPAFVGIVSSPSTAPPVSSTASPAAAAAAGEASLGEGAFFTLGVQSVNLVISVAFHFGAASNEDSSSSSSSLS